MEWRGPAAVGAMMVSASVAPVLISDTSFSAAEIGQAPLIAQAVLLFAAGAIAQMLDQREPSVKIAAVALAMLAFGLVAATGDGGRFQPATLAALPALFLGIATASLATRAGSRHHD